MTAPATPVIGSLARPLQIGPYRCDTPVVLAPMAGITNPGFRRLCREQGAGFYVCEMITSCGLVERNPLTFRMIAFDADEHPRSLQLYGVDLATVGSPCAPSSTKGWPTTSTSTSAARSPRSRAAAAGRRCPTSGGCSSGSCAPRSATPGGARHRQDADRDRRRAPHPPRGRPIAADAGVAAVALHARTASQRYSGTADWSEIARLRDALPAEVPVLGNGDIFGAADASPWSPRPGARRCRDRPGLPGPAVVVRRSGGGVRRAAAPDAADVGAGRGDAAPARRAALCPHGSGQGHPRRPQAHRLVPQGLRGRFGDPPPARARRQPGRARRAARHARRRPGVPGRGRGSARTAGLARPGRAAGALADDPDDPSVPFGAELEHSGG